MMRAAARLALTALGTYVVMKLIDKARPER